MDVRFGRHLSDRQPGDRGRRRRAARSVGRRRAGRGRSGPRRAAGLGGSAGVMRPGPRYPLGVIELARTCQEVGIPDGVVNVVTSSTAEAGAALVESPDVDMVSFTGSTVVGQAIYRSGASTMKRLLMEL